MEHNVPEPLLTDKISNFFYSIGNEIIGHPNKLFYAILIIASVLVPYLGAFILLSILYRIYRR